MEDKYKKVKIHDYEKGITDEDPWTSAVNFEAYVRQRKVKSSKINSWEYVSQLRDEMIEDADMVESLEPAWEVLNEHYGEIFTRDVFGTGFKTPVEEFIYHISNGFYPRPELLVTVAHCFEQYFSKQGEVELEDVFFGQRTKRIGNYSSVKSHARVLNVLDRIFRMSRSQFSKNQGIKPKTLIEAAEETIIQLKLDIDPESLLKAYRRSKSR